MALNWQATKTPSSISSSETPAVRRASMSSSVTLYASSVSLRQSRRSALCFASTGSASMSAASAASAASWVPPTDRRRNECAFVQYAHEFAFETTVAIISLTCRGRCPPENIAL